VILKAIGGRHDVLTMTAWQLTLGGLPILALSAVVENGAAVSWTFPYLVWNYLARHEEIGRLTLFHMLVPAFGVALAAVVFGDRLGVAEPIGLTLTVAGVGLVTFRRTGLARPGYGR